MPAVTVAQALTPTFAGIRSADVPGFVVAQFGGCRGRDGAVPMDAAEPARCGGVCEYTTRGGTVVKTIIFACVHNAGRSQMAAALFNAAAASKGRNQEGPEGLRAVSAGTEPAARVHPEVVTVMREIGIDLADARPQLLTTELAQNADLLITMGCGDKCPFVPGLKIEDWPLDDPKGQPIERVGEIREEIRERVATLVDRL
jgi:arsenate reductase (thioredoxin)